MVLKMQMTVWYVKHIYLGRIYAKVTWKWVGKQSGRDGIQAPALSLLKYQDHPPPHTPGKLGLHQVVYEISVSSLDCFLAQWGYVPLPGFSEIFHE